MKFTLAKKRLRLASFFFVVLLSQSANAQLTPEQLSLVKAIEQNRIAAIDNVIGSVIAIYDENRQGGGSGVIIDPSGIALTNHHVIIGAGIQGWGGLTDGKMYHWKLVGTDPGGDVSIIQMQGRDDFPFTPLGDSDKVQVGDWALAMGNPFILTEDQKPTVTLGIVSGVKRYQHGAGKNQLVYGNCIQVDSSINPGNSGGPLFNLNGEIIGINGRGSFQERGRVNVGLGYAISSNQIKNFIPELLATKLVEHGTLDANFSDRSGRVVCSTINEFAPIYKMGLRLGDELLVFEGIPVQNANQFTNLICTLPEDWPAELKVKTTSGDVRTFYSRLIGLPYAKPKPPPSKPGSKDKSPEDESPEEKRARERAREMIALLSAPPGTIRNLEANRKYTSFILSNWGHRSEALSTSDRVVNIKDSIFEDDILTGRQEMWITPSGKFVVERTVEEVSVTFGFDGDNFFRKTGVGKTGSDKKILSRTEAKLTLPIVEALGILSTRSKVPFETFGQTLLDGSDKAQQRNAFRFKTIDNDDDWFYCWYSMYDEQGRRSTQLLSAAADLDCDEKNGGVDFKDWRETEGWQIPFVREYIDNLGHFVKLTSKTETAQTMRQTEFTARFGF